MFVSADLLRKHCAYCRQIATFRQEWPDGCEVTAEIVARAVQLDLDLDWAARHLLTAAALKTYKETNMAAWDTYWAITARKPHLEVAAGKTYREAAAADFLAAVESVESVESETCAFRFKL